MCGIVGMFDDVNKSRLESYWIYLEHRGYDSYGIVGKTNKDRIKTVKSLYDKNVLEKVNNFKWVIAHNRWASIGDKNSLELAHPVINKGIYIIHNGTKKSLYETINGAKSDTQAIVKLYSDLKVKQNIFKYLDNTGVIFIIDTHNNKIVFHKDKTRPLYINTELKMFSSEPIDKGTWQMISPQNRVYSLKDFNFEIFTKKLNLEKKVLRLENLKIDFCEYCEEFKILGSSKHICPHCDYTDAKPKYTINWDAYDNKYKNWKGGIV